MCPSFKNDYDRLDSTGCYQVGNTFVTGIEAIRFGSIVRPYIGTLPMQGQTRAEENSYFLIFTNI